MRSFILVSLAILVSFAICITAMLSCSGREYTTERKVVPLTTRPEINSGWYIESDGLLNYVRSGEVCHCCESAERFNIIIDEINQCRRDRGLDP